MRMKSIARSALSIVEIVVVNIVYLVEVQEDSY